MRLRLALVFLVVAGVAAMGCEEEETKLEACVRLGQAYCEHEKSVGCPALTSPCVSAECYNYFDGDCVATAADIEKVDHDIENVIRTKATCDSLRSVDNYLVDTVEGLSAGQCGNAASFGTLGEMCGEVIRRGCEKNIELGCYNLTMPECIELAFASGLIGMGNGYGCSDPDDATLPVSENVTYYDEMLEEIANTTACG